MTVSGDGRRVARGVPAVAVLVVLACLCTGAVPASAGASVDAIADGGFEATTCAMVPNEWGIPVPQCENPEWTREGTQAMSCRQDYCRPDSARTGEGYARIGGGSTATETEYSGALTQAVDLPQGGPKVLEFSLRILGDAPMDLFPDGYTVGNFAVTVDGDALFTATADSGASSWQAESIDLGHLSGEHEISFSTDCTRLLPPRPAWIVSCDEFDVDDVSLMVEPDPAGPAVAFSRTPKRVTRKRTARFRFTSAAAHPSFECKLDRAGYTPCRSPEVVHVRKGRHRFKVRASSDGHTSKPRLWTWRVKRHRGR